MFDAYRLVPVLVFPDTGVLFRSTNRLSSAFDVSSGFWNTANDNFMLGGRTRSPLDLSFSSFLDPTQSVFSPGFIAPLPQAPFPMGNIPVFLLDPGMLNILPIPPAVAAVPPGTPPAADAPPAAAAVPPGTPPAAETPPAAAAVPPGTPPAAVAPPAAATPSTAQVEQNRVIQLIDAQVAANKAASPTSPLSNQIIETMRNGAAPLDQNLDKISGVIHGEGFNSLQSVSNIARDLDTSLVNTIKQDLSSVGVDFQAALGNSTTRTVADVNKQLGDARKIFNETTAALKKP